MATVGQRLSYDGALCTVRYVGEVVGTSGLWLGVEWDDPSRGKHDGQHKGVRYFTCKLKSPTAASFVRPTRRADAPQTFLSALHQKYASELETAPEGHDGAPPTPHEQRQQVIISGKVAEEVGFDKIRRKLAQLGELKIVILDGACVARSRDGGDDAGGPGIREVCPNVTELDLSRNLFTRVGSVVEICTELALLRNLRLNGNRFQDILEDQGLEGAEKHVQHVKELALEETLMGWDEILHIASKFPSLASLLASSNQLGPLSGIPDSSITSTLVSLSLEYNEFTSLSDIAPLASLRSLRNLHLKGNLIASISNTPSPPSTSTLSHVIFSPSLHYLDISYNQVATWSFVDALPDSFPGLVSLRFAHNPIYDNPELDTVASTSAANANNNSKAGGQPTAASEEAHMLLVARLPGLRAVNFSAVTPADRTNAEMFYLSRVARQLAAVPEADAPAVLARHRHWAALCAVYGEPAVVRRQEVDPNFLEARLIAVDFRMMSGGGEQGQGVAEVQRTVRIPKAFDMYTVKGIAGKLFGVSPLQLRLVWETGEWDPVAGLDDEAAAAENSDEEGEEEDERETVAEGMESNPAWEQDGLGVEDVQKGGGRWVKREVELRDGPRQFGYCVDGPEVRIRVELRS